MLDATPTTMNLPNILTIIRIVLVPVFLLLIFSNSLYVATIVFAVAGLTDLIDGIIARKYGSVTRFGANLDPVADKLLLSSAFIALSIKEFIPLWLAIIVVARDSIMITTIMILEIYKIRRKYQPDDNREVDDIFSSLKRALCAALSRHTRCEPALYLYRIYYRARRRALHFSRV